MADEQKLATRIADSAEKFVLATVKAALKQGSGSDEGENDPELQNFVVRRADHRGPDRRAA